MDQILGGHLNHNHALNRFVVISGCSGGGKSTLLSELSRRGFATVEEPGRRIVMQELEAGGSALPWTDIEAFLHRASDLAHDDLTRASALGSWVFFDRGLIDAAAGLERVTGEPASRILGSAHLYHQQVFIAPPWPEIYVTDQERRHDFGEAVAEYDHLSQIFPTLGYKMTLLPKKNVAERADFILDRLKIKR